MSKFLKSVYTGIAIFAVTTTTTLGAFPAVTAFALSPATPEPIINSIEATENDNGTVTFTVNASGGEVGNYMLFYKFYTLDEKGEKIPINQNKGIGQNYSTDNTYICKPGTDGKFRVYVEVQNSENEVVSDTKTYEIKKDDSEKSNLKVNKIINDVTQDTVVGSKVNISADVTSEDTDLSYEFTVCDSDGQEVFSKGTSKNNVVWTPDKADEFVIKVEVTDSQGNTASKTEKVVIGTSEDDTAKELTVKLSLDSEDIYVNKPVTIKVQADGGIGDKKYKFKDSSSDGTTTLKDYSEDNEIEWTPTSEGTHTLTVLVKDSSGVTKSDKATVSVKAQKAEDDKPSDKPGTNPGDISGGSQGGGSDVGDGDNDSNKTGDLSKGILSIGTFAVMSLGYIASSLRKRNK